jgi:hypothetical protein
MLTALRVANLKELTLAALKPSELHIREIVKLSHVKLPPLAGTVLYVPISSHTGADD